MLHLTERRHDYRTPARVTVRVYSNQPAVRLTVNGRALPEMPVVDHVATWTEVQLTPARNRIAASSGDLPAEALWTHDPNAPPPRRPAGPDRRRLAPGTSVSVRV